MTHERAPATSLVTAFEGQGGGARWAMNLVGHARAVTSDYAAGVERDGGVLARALSAELESGADRASTVAEVERVALAAALDGTGKSRALRRASKSTRGKKIITARVRRAVGDAVARAKGGSP